MTWNMGRPRKASIPLLTEKGSRNEEKKQRGAGSGKGRGYARLLVLILIRFAAERNLSSVVAVEQAAPDDCGLLNEP